MTVNISAAPLSAPLYGASFGQAISRFFKKYATFSGRASRSEFWWWFLINTIVAGVLYGIAAAAGAAGSTVSDNGMIVPGPGFAVAVIPYSIWALATFIPWLALAWRRLHDTNRSGGWYFIGLVPFIGGIILLVFFLLPSDPAGARFDR
ncbi:DUF805 domain-containing protein [Agromyces badenianii]|uniref:DUF805 domain-containing protein n=1 Tax=Agromyces badenianii TaxID=2080742 RepID=A0A2S0WTJ6_9MICO|nr:DUF805 domain-containing protein [Agromyces badenianii]AWB94632.1 DUF805 domain-containing protein [Agromyces badenianii]